MSEAPTLTRGKGAVDYIKPDQNRRQHPYLWTGADLSHWHTAQCRNGVSRSRTKQCQHTAWQFKLIAGMQTVLVSLRYLAQSTHQTPDSFATSVLCMSLFRVRNSVRVSCCTWCSSVLQVCLNMTLQSRTCFCRHAQLDGVGRLAIKLNGESHIVCRHVQPRTAHQREVSCEYDSASLLSGLYCILNITFITLAGSRPRYGLQRSLLATVVVASVP